MQILNGDLTMSKKINAIGYCRVDISTQTEQDKEIAAQKEQILEAARHSNIEIVEWFIQEGYEPMNFPYKALDKAHEYCEENFGIEYLLIASPDRISRSMAEFQYWNIAFERLDIAVKSCANSSIESAEDSYMRALIVSVGQLGNQQRSEAVKAGLRHKKAKEEE